MKLPIEVHNKLIPFKGFSWVTWLLWSFTRKPWVRKCFMEAQKINTIVVMLIPARTDTRYFHEFIYHKAREIRFIRGRLKFGDQKNSAPFPSMVVVF